MKKIVVSVLGSFTLCGIAMQKNEQCKKINDPYRPHSPGYYMTEYTSKCPGNQMPFHHAQLNAACHHKITTDIRNGKTYSTKYVSYCAGNNQPFIPKK